MPALGTALTEKCRVIAIDLPGFGASEGDRRDMSPTAQGAHLAAIFDELDLHDIHLVGPDVGMGAALAYVLNHTHRVKSLADWAWRWCARTVQAGVYD